ncbi:yersiniabactin nonribosomal peptide/polyketide synthase [Pseudoalteromonas citrea]|uniref:Yersiniabactin nonribosomal peptide/polyketide synthase n=2 Tax=Pseudoalteromonas citrea TaxID=43655 RepID=A0AAD4AG54_9GAMM|nr:type I polyketide synthase [Pseudoalteromonas citrea]KAF7767624.1 yersiniabactin nonribosomal peptide/polyketide synthase [Pseudoalteromonas citrea]
MSDIEYSELDIAIVGMAGRFPDASNVEELWQNVAKQHCSITQYSDEQLHSAGVDSDTLADPDYVKAGVSFSGVRAFDAGFFGYSPKEVEQLDPQQRIFLQTCWHALEDAGITPSADNLTGVFAGCGVPSYLLQNLLSNNTQNDITSLLALTNGNDKDSLSTRVSYELNLKGPSVTVQTACSTSLVAVHMACRSLQNFESDAALAGGVWLNLASEQGYHAPAGGSLSPTGRLSAFSENADGILIGSGSAAVVLKRVEDARNAGDTILAVIRGSAVNNDGKDKIGYTAPSVTGQANAVSAALEFADVEPSSIGYIETHGTGTKLGDPIEIAALSQAYQSDKTQYCAIGSIKANIGHLDSAAGVTGLIKAVQALRYKQLPPSIHAKPLNPAIDFAASPFYVNDTLKAWESDTPRRAAVSSLGMGGTNAHVILEEYVSQEQPAQAESTRRAPWYILPVSGATKSGLNDQVAALQNMLVAQPHNLPAAAAQLQQKRAALAYRKAFVVKDHEQAVAMLSRDVVAMKTTDMRIGLLFSGQGSQYVTMAQPLLKHNAYFKSVFNETLNHFSEQLQQQLTMVFAPEDDQVLIANQLLNQTRVTQPALFIVGYAMARTYQALGVTITGMLGHSIGEYVAACLANVMSLETAVTLVTARGEALQGMAPGTMLSVVTDKQTIAPYLTAELDIAALNSPTNTVVAGTKEAIKALQTQLKAEQISCTRLHVSHAFHSHLTEAVLPEFKASLEAADLSAPDIAFVSNVTGQLITDDQATSVQYWLDHIRQPVKFAEGVQTLSERCDVLIEAGPGDTLQKLVQQVGITKELTVLNSIAHVRDMKDVIAPFAKTAATLWQLGLNIDWQYVGELTPSASKVLPEYQFSQQEYWVEVNQERTVSATRDAESSSSQPQLLQPIWQQQPLHTKRQDVSAEHFILLASDSQVCSALSTALIERGAHLTTLWAAQSESAEFTVQENGHINFDHTNPTHWEKLHAYLADDKQVTHFVDTRFIEPAQSSDVIGYEALLPLVQHLIATFNVRLSVLATQLFSVLDDESLSPEKATLLGLTRGLSLEHNTLTRVIEFKDADIAFNEDVLTKLVADLVADKPEHNEIAYRGKQRFVLSQQAIPASADTPIESGVTLITGGLGGVGLHLAKYLGEQGHKLILQTRGQFAPESQWQALQQASETDDKLRKQLTALLSLRAQNIDVMVITADVLDAVQLGQSVTSAEQQLGTITHVVHSAGLPGGGFIAGMTMEHASVTLSSKIQGTQNVLKVFKGHALQQFAVCSSLASVLGAYGQSDYCAANVYLDTLAQQPHNFPVVSINWDAWAQTGMAAKFDLPEGLGLQGDIGAAMLADIFACGQSQVYAASMSWSQLVRVTREAEQSILNAKAKPAGHGRPDLDTEYEAPESELEHKLVAVWREFLGFDEIGVFDSLFALGGDSLIAIQMLAKVKQQFSIELEPAEFFEDPSIDNLAYIIEGKLIEQLSS